MRRDGRSPGGGGDAPRRSVVALALAISLAVPLFTASSGLAADALDPYRRFVTTPSAIQLVTAARAAMERYWSDPSAETTIVARDSIPDWPGAPVPIYLTLRDGQNTRACVGSPVPVRASLAATVEALAIEALHADRRRPALRQSELAHVRVVIAFTDEGAVVEDPMLVDPGREGLLIGSPRGHVAFLPGEARTVRWALSEAKRVGVLDPRTNDATFRRLEVVTVTEAQRRAPPPKADEEGEASDR